MKTISRFTAACIAISVLCLSPALAADTTIPNPHPRDKSVEPERQQDKMKRCNAEAGKKALKGDERRAFMSACLKG